MSSYLFYSSPPPASHRQHQTTSFFTPQTHRTTPFAAWSSFQPKSSSPLRTSSHANVIRAQSSATKNFDYYNTHENAMQENSGDNVSHESTPFVHGTPTISSTSDTEASPPIFMLETTPQNIFATNSVPSITKTPFQFQQRARESTSKSQISSRISDNRSSRKSEFTDRLRRTRRDERDNRGIESFEKAEYWRERRAREEAMLREATALEIADDEPEEEAGIDMLDLQGEAESRHTPTGELSPVSEEREVDELVEAYFQQPHGEAGHDQQDDFMSDSFEDDPEYEQAFMEVLSQERGPGTTRTMGSNLLNQDTESSHGYMDQRHGLQDRDMDMT